MTFIYREEGLFMSEQFNYTSVLTPYMNHLLEMKASAGISAQRTKWILKEFDDFASIQSLDDPHITEAFIQKWRSTRVADCDRTLYAKYSVWFQLTTMMSRNGCVCFIPKLPKQPKSNFTPYIFTHEQIEAIFQACDNYRLYDIRMGTALMAMPAILRLLYSTGARISEALSVRNKDIHLEEHFIHLHKTKNGSKRILPVGDSLAKVLSQYETCRNRMPIKGLDDPERLFFIKTDGIGFNAGTVYQHFKKLLSQCGIPHIGNHQGPRVHDLRHTSAVHALVQMANCGMDLYTSLPVLSAYLGHHSLVATEQYVRLTCAMYPELEKQCSPINAFVYPKICKAYDYHD
jgi:integrase